MRGGHTSRHMRFEESGNDVALMIMDVIKTVVA
jgi:hypothetical protein